MQIPWDYLYNTARTCLTWTAWEFWSATPRMLLACLDEYWYTEDVKAYRQAEYNLRFMAVLVSKDAEVPELPERKNAPDKIVTTNDAGEAFLKGLF